MLTYSQFMEEFSPQHQISDEHGRSNVPVVMHNAHNSLSSAGYKRVGFHSNNQMQTHHYEHPNKPAVTVQHHHDGDQAPVTVHHETSFHRDATGKVTGTNMSTREQGKGHSFISSIK